jgi:protoporphyrin/coproporphyrin ferrochelatase
MKTPGALLVNLGAPDSPQPRDVRRFLRESFMDGRVLDVLYPIRLALVHGRILPFETRPFAEAYRKVWLAEGSPLCVISKRVTTLLQQRVPIPIELGMRYQNPSIEGALQNLVRQNVEELLLIPMFPQYSMSGYETAVERVRRLLKRKAPRISLSVVPPYYDHPDYLKALVAGAAPYLEGNRGHLLFSFHGLPEKQLRKSDPTGFHCLKAKNCCEKSSAARATCYRAQCLRTASAFVETAGIPVPETSVAFQSGLGQAPWMQPTTDVEFARLARGGVRKLTVICPSFVTDNLETLEQTGVRGRELFLAAGGREFQLIPCLNEQPLWLDFLERLVREFAGEKADSVFSDRPPTS